MTGQLEDIEGKWEKLNSKLEQRENRLEDALDLSRQYYDVLQDLTDWTAEFNDQIEHLPIVRTQPDLIEQQRQYTKVYRIEVLEMEF